MKGITYFCLLISGLFIPAGLFAQVAERGILEGTIRSTTSQAIGEANVVLSGQPIGTKASATGAYHLTAPAGSYTLVVSAVGFIQQPLPITVVAGQKQVLDVVLTEQTTSLREVVVTGVRAITGMGYLAEINDNVIYSGKKTEVLLLDKLDANTPQNNPRQVLGRVPGANYSETEGSGFPTNGIGFRGLNPSQSIETNTRQNGYNITADLYGYPESYYLPPLEAVERIEVTRGASSLQFGPQFGGVINYVLRQGNPNARLESTASLTGGSFGFVSAYYSLGGQSGKWNYVGFGQYKAINGWRPNSDYRQVSAYGRVGYQANDRLSVALEYSLLRNRIHMPGGFTDAQFATDSRASFRARNWLESPWNVLAATLTYQFTPQTKLTVKTTGNASARNLVWRNEDGGPAAIDSVSTLTNQYVNREVQRESFLSTTTEARLLHDFQLGKLQSTLATGMRFFSGNMHRQGGGLGTTGTDFDMTLLDPRYEYDLHFTTTNYAFFAENTLRLNRLSLTPGLRYEYLYSTAKGYTPADNQEPDVEVDQAKKRHILLAGVGAQYKASATTNIYANWSQAYRPVDYANLTPFGSIASVDPNLKDARGYNIDLGYRGYVRDYFTFDVGVFYLQYTNRIGLIERTAPDGTMFPYRTNVANSAHKGLESYLEFNPVKAFARGSLYSLSVFNSLALIDARYTSGEFQGKYVDYAPAVINRTGLIAGYRGFSTTLLVSYTSQQFSDANNSIQPSEDAVAGLIPAYTVLDWSATWRIKTYQLRFGTNNLTDRRYFTKRTDEYPGPGIIPSVGRSIYAGFSIKF
ncbi:carboxypeptidase-like regulatory domain-containing protein [Fibrella sp. HMF5335]|uniref:Carboxypeptidase-like regulatory domain-containing protein n=1 Tax=Fibrella rubiginis TaxID=2817060 RepID=A0A939K2H0_9BACT|nr:TonB-dependent receptor [Fibrella rubiginis]MBO0936309.1 carboxypeptidase-like regulatory domain-containing protein [Fibrella rubiginis]